MNKQDKREPQKPREPVPMSTFRVPHVGFFIAEELEARGWTVADLARRMPGDFGMNHLCIEMIIAVDRPNLRIGDTAEKFAVAFDVSSELFRNLEAAFIASHAAGKEAPAEGEPESLATVPR